MNALTMNVLAICGSLRTASVNRMLLHTAIQLAPPGMSIRMYPTIGELPLYNPDLECSVPKQVKTFRNQVADSQALIIASPEYAHGMTGAIKNALDWMVSVESFANKPVAVLNASPRARHADAALRETLRTMSAVIVEEASICVSLLGTNLTADDVVCHPTMAIAIRDALIELQTSTIHHISRLAQES